MKRAIITIGLMALLLSGQAIAKDFYADGNIITGEYWSSVYIYDTPPNHTTVNMSGGRVDTTSIFDASILNMTGGTMFHLFSYEFSTANISGNDSGSPLDIFARDNSIINFSGTAQGMEVQALNTAIINITGGAIEDLTVSNSGIINIYAGDILDALARDNAIINIFGHELVKWSSGGAFGCGFVQGYYNDNYFFNFSFRGSETYSHVNLIPEPTTILLLVAGGIFLRKKD